MGVTGPFRCASCDEPLEPGDNYCGFCGADVVGPAGPDGTGDRPTVPLGDAAGHAAPGAAGPAGSVTLPAGFLMPGAVEAGGSGQAAGPGEVSGPVQAPEPVLAPGPVPPPVPVAAPTPSPAPPYAHTAAYGAQTPACGSQTPAYGARTAAYGTQPPSAYGAQAGHDGNAPYAPGATAHPNGAAPGPHAPVPPPPPGYAPGGPQADAQSRPPHAEASVPPSSGPAPGPHGDAPDPRVVGYGAGAESSHGPSGDRTPGASGEPVHPPQPPGAPLPTGPASSPEHQTPAQGTRICSVCHAGTVAQDGYCENCGHAQPRERDHMERELPGVAAVSDRGHRHHRNEDFFAISQGALPDGSPAVLAVVCDGVSSASRPDDASAAASGTAARSLLAALPAGTHPQRAMHDAIIAAAKAVNALAAAPHQPQQHDPYRQQNAPACTFVGAVVGGGLLVIGWVGDSRAYWIPDDRSAAPVRLTEDDSWAAQMVANNLMSEAEAYADDRAHAITGWLGADAYELEPHTASFKPDGPGVVVVCTDGLWNYAEAAEQLAAVLPADAHDRPLHSARTLVAHALAGGGHDNVTVAVVPFPAPR
ncbi:phosphatase [Streptomyces rimosus subsp. pseudoverticillatus]|uniref:PP2C family protein-serine/threonine phosphatase n=1 Tax=Streptomyces rimosus TaxID=1927 RepID=UPI0006B2A8F6|nr:PP2C family serine/threonine-protein phosphatase [Streptomyces rimosus]KOT98396.1 phosphatase [Streptomyces rimosus subsp. pseudoverticillatus]